MTKRDAIKKELDELYKDGANLVVDFKEKKETQFEYDYQRWYTKAIKAVESLALGRLEEFRKYYEVDPKRKELGYGNYVIQDYIKGVSPSRIRYEEFDTRSQVLTCFSIS